MFSSLVGHISSIPQRHVAHGYDIGQHRYRTFPITVENSIRQCAGLEGPDRVTYKSRASGWNGSSLTVGLRPPAQFTQCLVHRMPNSICDDWLQMNWWMSLQSHVTLWECGTSSRYCCSHKEAKIHILILKLSALEYWLKEVLKH